MPENMSICVNGQSQVPPGFRFHPTEEELLRYYLKKKVSYEKIDLDVIRDVDLNKLEPWDIQEMCKIGTTPQNDWYFFSHKDKKYPTGTRTNRATEAGFWKATGRDKVIYSNGGRIGMRKTLVFYKGRAPHGRKSDWIMHEYRLDDNTGYTDVSNVTGEGTGEEGWVVCRIFKKKNHHKTLDSPLRSLSSSITPETRTHVMFDSWNERALDQVLISSYMGSPSLNEETEGNNVNHNNTSRFLTPININGGFHHDQFLKLPYLEGPNSTAGSENCYEPIIPDYEHLATSKNKVSQTQTDPNSVYNSLLSDSGLTNWAALDRLVASQLNGVNTIDYHDHLQVPTVRSLSSSSSSLPPDRSCHGSTHQDFNSGDTDLWNLMITSTRPSSLSDLVCHVSKYGV